MLKKLGFALLMAGAAVSSQAQPKPAVVVELYQSQGCSSCPPADLNVNALADRTDVLALSFAVTYWDQLGWKDTFARDAFTARQYDYAKGFKRSQVATPQVVINGRSDLVGNDRRQLDAAIAKAAPLPGPVIAISFGKVSVAAAPAAAEADVWLVRYDPRVQQVAVRRGENAGKTLPHRNIVEELVRLGAWNGKSASFALPVATDPGLKTAILVQTKRGGPILAAAKA